LLVAANVAVKFRRTGSCRRPTSRDYTFISLSAVRLAPETERIQIDTLPRHAASDARRVSHTNTAVSPCRHTRGYCGYRQTRRTCVGNLQACVTNDEICGQIPCEANGSSARP